MRIADQHAFVLDGPILAIMLSCSNFNPNDGCGQPCISTLGLVAVADADNAMLVPWCTDCLCNSMTLMVCWVHYGYIRQPETIGSPAWHTN